MADLIYIYCPHCSNKEEYHLPETRDDIPFGLEIRCTNYHSRIPVPFTVPTNKTMMHRPVGKEKIIKVWQNLGEPYPSTDNLMKIRQLTGYGLYAIKETIVNFVLQKSAEWLKTF